jgi:GNAT superfamily N-acetyltransferase
MTPRSARPEDAQRICDLMRQLGYEVPAIEIARRLAGRDDAREVFVAGDETTTVGWAAVCIEHGFIEGRVAWIEGFIVDEGSRSAGIGRELLGAVERWARQRDCTTMRVQSNVVRERAHAFYERNGYIKIKAQFALRKTL